VGCADASLGSGRDRGGDPGRGRSRRHLGCRRPDCLVRHFTILRNVSDPITTPHNFTPGAVAYQLGASAVVATWIQVISSVAVLVVVVLAALRASAAASFLATVVASQLLSPVLWDHYAMLLLLPVAFLLDRRQWWSAAIPLATSVFIIGIAPPVAYPIAFWVALVAVLAVGLREPPETSPTRLS